MTGLALGIVLGPFISALLLGLRRAGRALLRPRRTAKR